MRLFIFFLTIFCFTSICRADFAYSQPEKKPLPPSITTTNNKEQFPSINTPSTNKKSLTDDTSDEIRKKNDNLFARATDKQIEEAQRFYRKCTQNETMNEQKDCKCATTNYLETRIKLGDDATVKQIMDENINKCLKNGKYSVIKNPEKFNLNVSETQIKEAEEVYQWCKNTPRIKTDLDCECLASEFLNKRVKQGPIPSRDEILIQITRYSCKNIIETTGFEYKRCMVGTGFTYGNIRPKDYCECYARTWGKRFEQYTGKIDSNVKSNIRLYAKIYCSKPKAYKK